MAATEGNLGSIACPASATTQLGSAGSTTKGGIIERIVLVPGTTSPGAVQIKDGGDAAITIFAGGATSVADLKPIVIELQVIAKTGQWAVIVGANISALATGRFF